MGSKTRNSKLSEIGLLRAGYYFLYVRNMMGLNISQHELLQKVKWIEPKVIIANSVQDFVVLKYLRKKGLKFKSIYIDHGSLSTSNTKGYFSKEGIPLTIGTGINALSLQDAKRKFFNFFDMNVALNLNQLKAISKYTRKVNYIPNGLNVATRKEPKYEELLRKKFGISKKDFVVLYVGRMFDRQKNVKTLVKAFKETKGHNLKLLLLGDGPSLPEYQELASKDARIIFVGPKPSSELNAIYNISNLFVVPSRWEGFTLTTLEAAAHNLPLLLSRDAYIPDLHDPKIPSIPSFNTTDANALKRQIELILGNNTVREKAIKASKVITKLFTEQKMLKAYKDLILRLGT